ncbi:hypothetical protein D044_4230A, partial [Vibrio parahaemolyticus EKP-026]
MVARRAHNPKV